MKIIDRPVKNHSARPEGADIDCIVVHNTGGGTLNGAIAWWNDPESNASAHYLIDRNGDAYRCVPEERKAWHAGKSVFRGQENVNDFSIGIELLSDGSEYTAAQYLALHDLTIEIMQRHPYITVDRITGHEDVALPKGRKCDPGKQFEWNDYRAAIRASL